MEGDLVPSSGRSHFSMVMADLHQKFTEENIGVYEDDSHSWTGCDSANRTGNVLTPACSCSTPEFRHPTTRRTRKPRHGLTPTMGPICAATIQLALISLRSVPHPADFPTETTKSFLLSPTQPQQLSPRVSANTVGNDDSEVQNQNVLRSINNSRELTRSVNAYLKSVNFNVESQQEVEYELTSDTYDELQPTLEKDDNIHNTRQSEQLEPITAETPIQQPPEMTIKRIESFGSGDQLKDQNQQRTTSSFLEQILESKKNLKPVDYSIGGRRNSDTVGLQDVEMMDKKKKRRGFFSRLKFLNIQPKTIQDDIEIVSKDSASKDKKTSRRCRLLCCFPSPLEVDD